MFNSPASASLNFMPSYFPAENNNCGFGKGIHYTAFFCKMELRTVDHYNVWIKLHAGDYDRYTKSNLPE